MASNKHNDSKLHAAMITYYNEKIKNLETFINGLQKKDNYFSVARLSSFLLFLPGLIFSITTGHWLVIIITSIVLIGFIKIVLMHLKNHATLATALARKKMLGNEISCLQFKPNAYYNGFFFRDANHDYTLDMDVFGENSLFHYVNRCATGVGNKALARWMSKEHPLEQIKQRQQAIIELANLKDWCEELRVNIFERRIKDFGKEHLPHILKTMSAPKKLKTWVAVSYILLALSIAGIIFGGLNASLLMLPVFFNIYLNHRMGNFIKTIRAQLDGREKTLNDYRHILTTFEEQHFNTTYLNQLQQELTHNTHSATESISRLQSLSKKLDYSLNMIVGAILNLFFVWDLIICNRISKWFDRHAEKTSHWFEVAGRLEALISLANVHNNHGDWTYPTYSNDTFVFNGKDLGHPLIPENERVCNDFMLKDNAFVNIVTGSNMAGKSTFLRTVGVNIILAKTGAPVCASELHLSHFRIMTYLTITDSLSENTSTFYREIKRLKKILDSAREDNNVLLLLDELLRGTNSADKAKGSIAITRELIRHEVRAIIATHNLELAEMKNTFPEEVTNYFFDIIIDRENKMRFDYKLKPGVCNTFNASLLLKEIGIDIGE